MKTEQLIVSALVHLKEFKQKTLPYIEDEYFAEQETRAFFNIVKTYEQTYKKTPTETEFKIELESLDGLTQECFGALKTLSNQAYSDKVKDAVTNVSLDWLVNTTEKHCKDRSIYNAVMNSVEIITDSKKTNKDAIPSMLQDALNVSFKPTLGHDYIRDWEERYASYHEKIDRVRFPLTMLNKTTHGGLPKKSLAVPIAPTGVGKSMLLTYLSGEWLRMGYNVLYVTLEMAKEKIAERVDANLLNIPIEDMTKYPKETFETKINKLKKKTLGRLIVEEYPTGTMSAANLNALIDELETKEDFVPDVVCVDYLGLMKPMQGNSQDNSYHRCKYIAEEIRSIAMDRNLLVVAPHQTGRSAQGTSDFNLNEIADSAGISMTADWIIGMISTEELEQMGHMRFKQLKNRHGALTPRSFIVGVDSSKMKFFDVDDFDSNSPVNNNETQESDLAKRMNRTADVSSLTFD